MSTTGNEDCHVILRGGNQPNYDRVRRQRGRNLASAGIPARIMIDFSHGNSDKEREKQVDVGRKVAAQIAHGDARIFGVMVESHLKAGRQDLIPGKQLVYGQSITDACVGWEDTHALSTRSRTPAPTPHQGGIGKRHGLTLRFENYVQTLEMFNVQVPSIDPAPRLGAFSSIVRAPVFRRRRSAFLAVEFPVFTA